jgi:hypothetical protein
VRKFGRTVEKGLFAGKTEFAHPTPVLLLHAHKMKRRQPNEDGSYAVVSMKTPAPIASPRQFKALGAWRLGAPLHVRRLGLAAFVAVATGVVIAAATASIPSESLEGAVRRIDFASKLLTGIGLLAALTWALFKFVVSPGGLVDEIGETTYSNLKLDLALETAAYRGVRGAQTRSCLQIRSFVMSDRIYAPHRHLAPRRGPEDPLDSRSGSSRARKPS